MEGHALRPDSPETVGAYLREKRMSRGISLEKVSESTRISIAVLRALEEEDREKLPAEVYVKAFYKKYAEFLGVKQERVQEKYRQPQNPKKAGDSVDFSTVVTLKGKEENSFTEILRRLFLPIVIVLLGLLLYWIYSNYLASYHPLGFYRKNVPALLSFLFSSSLQLPV